MPKRNSVAQSKEYLEATSYPMSTVSFYQTVIGRPNLNVNGNTFSKSVSDPADRIVCMSVEYLKMPDLLLRKERAGRRTVEFPRGTVCIEDTMTEKRAHEPMKPIPYRIGRSHCAKRHRLVPNLSRTCRSPSPISSAMRVRWPMLEQGHGYKSNLNVCRFSGKDLQPHIRRIPLIRWPAKNPKHYASIFTHPILEKNPKDHSLVAFS